MHLLVISLKRSQMGYKIALVAIVALYCVLALGSALSRRPEVDEGMFANAAFNLVSKGTMGTTVLEPTGSKLLNIQRFTYWTPPLHLLAQAAWYKVFGFSLIAMRSFSILSGLVALSAWFLIVLASSGDRKLALLTVGLLSVDYTFLIGASLGRMDMMSAALGFMALSAYLILRERNFNLAIVTSHALVVASGLSHPNGILHMAGLLFLTFYFDRSRIRPFHVVVGAVPYVIGALAWGLYILQDPGAFLAQFGTNSIMGGRLSGLTAPWLGIAREFTDRYPQAFGLGTHSAGHSGPVYLKILILLGYLMGLLGAIFTRSIRQHKGYRAILILSGIYFLILALIDGQKQTTYLIHIFPFYVAITAIWIWHLFINRLLPVPVLVFSLSWMLALGAGGTGYRIKKNTYGNFYLPTIDFLKRTSNSSQIIMGTSALGFGLKFPDNLVDDPLYGYNSGKRADFLVFDAERIKPLNAARPEVQQYINRLLSENYRTVYENPAFQVYLRR